MNYDGKTLVIDNNFSWVTINNGNTLVIHNPEALIFTESTQEREYTIVFDNDSIELGYVLNNTNSCIVDFPLEVFTVNVYNKYTYFRETELPYLFYQNIIDKQIYNNKSIKDIEFPFVTNVCIERYIPSNIQQTRFSANIVDLTTSESMNNFGSFSINIIDKSVITIPESISTYEKISMVVQKNCFIEIRLSENIIYITGIPDCLQYLGNSIKGTFLESGEYTINIKYASGEQTINIIVPYYKRLL